MDRQRTFFDTELASDLEAKQGRAFTDTALPEDAKPRLGGQNLLILERLRVGPATNVELEECSGSRRVNSRIADVRRYLRNHHGQTIVCRAIDTAAGLHQYEIGKD